MIHFMRPAVKMLFGRRLMRSLERNLTEPGRKSYNENAKRRKTQFESKKLKPAAPSLSVKTGAGCVTDSD